MHRAELSKDGNIHLPYDQRVQVHHRVVARLAHRYTPQGRVLDVGCGLGHTLHQLSLLNPGLEFHGADMDETCLRMTRERVDGVTTISMRQGRFDVESLQSGYDTAISSHVLEHLPNPTEAIQALLSVLNPGGHLILVVPNLVTPAIVLHSTLRRCHVNPGHLHAWDRCHWKNFLENRLGAEVVEYASDEVRIFPARWKKHLLLLEKVNTAATRLLPWWSFSHIAVLRRR